MDMKNNITEFAQSANKTEMLVLDGVSIRLNYTNKQAPNTFENIEKALLQTHQMGKKTAQIQ